MITTIIKRISSLGAEGGLARATIRGITLSNQISVLGIAISLAIAVLHGSLVTWNAIPLMCLFFTGGFLLPLVANAVKFTQHGEIELRIEPIAIAPSDQNTLLFAVRDTGIGIDPGNRQKKFEAFEQADASSTKKFGGTGLGLTISNMLLALMSGKVEVKSELNMGSTFFFTVSFRSEA